MTALFGLGFPIRYYDSSFSRKSEKFVLIVQGEEGEFGSGSEMEAVATQLGFHRTLVRVSSAYHYFNGCIDEMNTALDTYFGNGSGGHFL